MTTLKQRHQLGATNLIIGDALAFDQIADVDAGSFDATGEIAIEWVINLSAYEHHGPPRLGDCPFALAMLTSAEAGVTTSNKER